MSDREKLIELLGNNAQCGGVLGIESCDTCSYRYSENCYTDALVSHLISNGVTVQKWIPVSEPPKDTGEYNVMIYGATKATSLFYDFGNDRWFDIGDEEFVVTRWMPLPEPPKECE